MNTPQDNVQSFANSYGGCEDITKCKQAVTPIQQHVLNLQSGVLNGLNSQLNLITPPLQTLQNQIVANLQNGLNNVETSYLNIVNKVQDNLLAGLANTYAHVNQLISQVQPTGFVPVGPLAFQPIQPGVSNVGSTTTTSVGSSSTGSTPQPNTGSGTTVLGSTNPPTTVAQTTPGATGNGNSVVQSPVAGSSTSGVSPVSNTTANNPYWVVGPIGSTLPSQLTVVTSSLQPVATNQLVFGPFYDVQSLNTFMEQFASIIPTPLPQVPNPVATVTPGCPVIVTVNCPSETVINNNPSQEEITPTVGGQLKSLVETMQQQLEQPIEYLEWIQTSEGGKAVYNLYNLIGVTEDDFNNTPITVQQRRKDNLNIGDITNEDQPEF